MLTPIKSILKKNHFFLLSVSLLWISSLSAQISEGGIPPSFSSGNFLRSSLPVQTLPIDFDVETLLKEDSLDASIGAPLRLGVVIPTSIDLMRDGRTVSSTTGQNLQLLSIQAPGAIATMLYYDEFYIPEGGRLFIYNAEKTSILGAYTNRTNPLGKGFATELLPGDEFVMEYVFPSDNNSTEHPRIRIDGLAYGYNHLDRYKTSGLRAAGFGTSGACQVNVNCSEGDNWQHQKKGVARTVTKIGTSVYYCSGSLINNTSRELIPYFLSAYHCFDFNGMTETTFSQILFYFHYETSGCENPEIGPNTGRTMVGAEKLAMLDINGESDGALLRLLQEIPESYDVFYNGWDVQDIAPLSGVGIHHPSGDIKKISTYTSRATSSTWNGTSGAKGAASAHWALAFNQTENGHGVTEGGSSGSPLFNQHRRIIGTLSGGNSTCDNPSGRNLYGKMWYHWNKGTKKMQSYLDPTNTGATSINGRYHAATHIDFKTDNQSVYKGDSIHFTNLSFGASEWLWSFPGGTPAVSTKEHPTVVYNTTGNHEVILRLNPNTPQETSDTLRYISVTERPGTLIPNSLTADVVSSNPQVIRLNWDIYGEDIFDNNQNDAPVSITDTIRWDNNNPSSMLSMGTKTYSILSLWSVDDMKQYKSLTITDLLLAISNYGADTTSTPMQIKAKIFQDNKEVYSQDIPSIKYNTYDRISLNSPVQIDLNKDMMFGYEMTQPANVYPVILDNGPTVKNKNFYRLGKTLYPFETLTQTNDPGNFCIAAIVEAEKLPPYRFNIHKNQNLIVSDLSGTTYSDTITTMTGSENCYQVSTVFLANNTESDLSNTVCISLSSSIDKAPDNQINIHPIPLKGTVKVESTVAILGITVTDSKGNIIYNKKGQGNSYSFDTHLWASGGYIIQIETVDGTQTRKVVK